MFYRTITPEIEKVFFSDKIIILTWPRQVGKTTLINTILDKYRSTKTILTVTGDHISTRDLFSSQDLTRLIAACDAYDIIFIDEGQVIPDIGTTLKILIDHYHATKQIIVTGSSSINLLSHISESLAWRKRVFFLYPISFHEVKNQVWFLEFDTHLEEILITGMYPRVLLSHSLADRIQELSDLASSALYKDILEFQSLKNSAILTKLLKILALQIGQELSLSRIGQELSLDGRTIERYIDLLEKSYIVYRLPPFYSNKKKEVIKMNKIYFYDLGIRNALLENFSPFPSRTDRGQLWENWVINEYKKSFEAKNILGTFHFWRGSNQQEIDLIHEWNGAIDAIEIKWNSQNTLCPSLFRELYPTANYREIHRKDYFTELI